MIHNDVQNQLQYLIKTSAPPLIEVVQSATETPQWAPGDRLPAHVLSMLPNGRFQVLVGDNTLDLNLPPNTQPGDKLELTFLSFTPRMTFALTQDLAQTLPGNQAVSLSDAAKFIGSLLQRGSEATQAAATAKGAALTANPTFDVQQLAASLKQALSQSGLFYEAHQVQWLSGERNLESLLQEPQGKLPPMPANPGDVPKSASSASTAANALAGMTTDAEPVHPKAVPLVQQQLQALDTHQVVWQGAVWPGQSMQWAIEEDGGRKQEEGGPSEQWRTRLHLDLPVMGGVSARLALRDGAFAIDIAAEDAETAARMRAAQGALADQFAAAGLALTGVRIQHER
jgi:hypothetical protein